MRTFLSPLALASRALAESFRRTYGYPVLRPFQVHPLPREIHSPETYSQYKGLDAAEQSVDNR